MDEQGTGPGGEKHRSASPAPEEARGIRGYATVLRAPGLSVWALVLIFQRIPVAMAPLALVYLGYEVTGSFAVGGVLVSAHALAEAAAAGWMGRRFDHQPAHREAALVLGAEGAFFLALFVFAHQLPLPLLVALAALGGGVSAGAYGGLRSLLQRMVPESTRPAAFGLEETMSATIWAASPALAGLLVAAGTGTWPIAAMAAASVVGALIAFGLPRPVVAPEAEPENEDGDQARQRGRIGLIWPSLFQDGAAMFTLGAASVSLPALLTSMGASEALPGLVLGAASAAGVLGGLVYGSRRWPHQRAHATGLLLLYCGVVGTVGALSFLQEIYLVGALFVVAGAVQVPALVSRALVVQQQLPQDSWGFAFSALYAAKGIGYGAAGLLAGAAIAWLGPALAVGACAAAAGLVALTAGTADLLPRRRNLG